MGEVTGIAWTDHTFNPWIGCTKISAGCANCYAARDNARYKWVEDWGKGKPRRMTSEANWKKPLEWARKAKAAGVVRRVFCASLADVFDAEVQDDWRTRLWELVEACADPEAMDVYGIGLEWLILTKRPDNIAGMMPDHWLRRPPSHIRLGVTVEMQKEDWRILELRKHWRGKNFVSYEPAIGPLDLRLGVYESLGKLCGTSTEGIDWLICGAESGPGARPMHPQWARHVRDQCTAAGIPFFLKQMMVNGKLVKLPELDGQVWAQFPEERP